MNSNWAEWAIKHKQVIHFFSALIAIMGIFCYAVLGRQEDPSFPLRRWLFPLPGRELLPSRWKCM